MTPSPAEKATETAKSNPVPEEAKSQCPVDHSKLSSEQLKRFVHPFRSPTAAKKVAEAAATNATTTNVTKTEAPEAPGAHAETAYDVYGTPIDPANMMPSTPNQLPSPGQTKKLSTERAVSTIPKGGAENGETWTYPSEQMFYNSLHRKGKLNEGEEENVDVIVHVHNLTNERTWAEVKAWENQFHCDTCPDPKLLNFKGRPDDLSPAARWRMWMQGYPRPFDRHDWMVDRCGAKPVRYVIDYYFMEEKEDPVELHVRPALDSASAVWDRLRANMPAFFDPLPAVSGGKLEASPLPVVKEAVTVSNEEYDALRTLTPQRIDEIADGVKQECSAQGKVLHSCKAENPDGKCEEANVALNYCMARQICRPLADTFMKALEDNGDEVKAYGEMTGCLERFHIMARRVMMDAAGVKARGPEFAAHEIAASAKEA